MREKTSMKWHEIINETPRQDLAFFNLFQEYADAVKERESKKRQEAYWPFDRE